MNILKNFAFALIAVMAASSLQAACLDRGYASFVENAFIVELCENTICITAEQYSSCGNVQYSAHSYKVGSEIWLFRIRMNNSEAGKGKEFAVEVRPSDPKEIPLTMVDGRPVRLLVGTPIEPVRTQRISCVPVSDAKACDFINAVLLGLN